MCRGVEIKRQGGKTIKGYGTYTPLLILRILRKIILIMRLWLCLHHVPKVNKSYTLIFISFFTPSFPYPFSKPFEFLLKNIQAWNFNVFINLLSEESCSYKHQAWKDDKGKVALIGHCAFKKDRVKNHITACGFLCIFV